MRFLRILPAAALLALASKAGAQTTQDKPWKNATGVTFLNTTGNNRTVSLGANNVFTGQWGRLGAELKGSALGSKDKGVTSAEQYNAGEKITWKLNDNFYTYEGFLWDKNRFAGIRNRYDWSTGLGMTILNSDKNKLSGELGGGYIYEQRINAPINDFAAGRGYAKYQRILSETANFTQDIEYLHDFEYYKNYRLNTETAIVSSLNSYLSLKASYRWKRVNRPPPGFVSDDTITSLALVVNY